MNYKIKLQIVNLLLDCIKSGRIRDKAAIVNQGSECFFIEHGNGIGKLIKKFPCMLFMLTGKTVIQFALLPMIRISN